MMMPINRTATGLMILALVPSIFHEATMGYPGVEGLFRLIIDLLFFSLISYRLIVALMAEEKEFDIKYPELDNEKE